MKILWLTEFFPKSAQGEITGGVEARCFYVSKYLKSERFDIQVIGRSTSGGNWQHATWTSIPSRISLTLKILWIGINTDFDIIEGTSFISYSLAWLLGRLKGKKVVYWYPDVYIGKAVDVWGSVGILGEIVERVSILLRPDYYIAISNEVKRKLIQNNIPESKIKVIYCGVDLDLTRKIDTTKKVYDICAVSRLVNYKRIVDLVKAVEILKKTYLKIKVVIVGQGPEKEKLMNLSSSLGLQNNITFYGYVSSHNDLLKIIGSSKILCHPSVVEGFGITVIEAASLGVPSVISDIPVLREVTRDGEAGLFFEIKNPTDLATKISLLFNDKKLFQQKSNNAFKLSEYYDWKEIAQETGKLYHALLKI